MTKPGINEFYDINRFPAQYGITVLTVSMPLITNRQKPENCIALDKHHLNMLTMSGVGAHIVYSDGLYLNTDEAAGDFNHKNQKLIEDHRTGYTNLINKDTSLIPMAFTFTTWSQHILETENFSLQLKKIKEFYDQDQQFQQYVHADIAQAGRTINHYTINYVLEEILVDFLTVKGQTNLPNAYVQGWHTWILNCYHGKPFRSLVYLHQQNPLGLENSDNQYQNACYDAEAHLLYEFDRLDIDSFDFS